MTQKKGFFGWVSRLFGKKKEVYEAPAVILIEREEPKPAPVAEVKVEPKAEEKPVVVKKAAPKKVATKKIPAKKPAEKKPTAKKTSAKPTAKKATKKPQAKKTTAKKVTSKKTK